MKPNGKALASLALGGALFASSALAQVPSPAFFAGAHYQDHDRSDQDRYDDRNWHAPRGYDDYYHENGQANMAARQGYMAGFQQGESDNNNHHSFRPTHVDSYKHVPESPKGINRDDFKRIYREAFQRGYEKGYGR